MRLACLILILGLCHQGSSLAAETKVMRVGNVIGDPVPGSDPHHMVQTQRYLSKLVLEKTNGEVEIRFLEGKSLPVFQMASMVETGETIDATNVPGFFLVRVPELDVQAIPYLFDGLEHARRFPRSKAAEYLAEKVERAYDAHVVSFLKIASTGSYNSMEPIRVPSDFAGKKIANIWELYDLDMYGEYKPDLLKEVSFSDAVDGAMFIGEFDVAIGLLQNNRIQKLYSYFKHDTVTPFLYNIYYTFIVNNDFWNDLTEQQQRAIDEAAYETEAAAVNLAEDSAHKHYQLLEKEDIQIAHADVR